MGRSGIEADLHSIRDDIAWLRVREEARSYADHLHAVDEMANEQAGMTPLERNYFDRQGKLAPTLLVKLSDWVARKRREYGL